MAIITNTIIGDYMRKKTLLIVVVLIVVILALMPGGEKGFRIRVIANSDSPADQAEKMAVVRILQEIVSRFDKSAIASEVAANIDVLDAGVRKVLGHDNYTLNIKKIRYPAKSVDGAVIPSGKYPTLLVVIGAGTGRNWWSLLYPDYHGISFEDAASGDIEYKSYFWEKLKKILLDR
jgi:stage II sporulation protein R